MATNDKKTPALAISAKDQKLLVVVGTIAIIVVCVWFFLRPMWATHVSLVQEQQSISAEIAQALDLEATQELLNSAKADKEQTNELLKGYSYSLDSAQVDRLTATMAKRYGFTIYNLAIDVPEEGAMLQVFGNTENALEFTGVDRVDLTMTLDGSRSDIQRFINNVEDEHPGVHINSYQWVDNADGKSWNLICNMSVFTRER